jgi:carbonic anhydrase/acetyltransferase-like protein (isoleucine patch superfamily)
MNEEAVGGSRPRFGERVFVAESAVLVGDVELADDVSIWFGAILRADLHVIRVGARTNIQDGVIIHVDETDFPTIIGADVTVGHAAVLHGCRVEDGALVGMNATVLNGAVIGQGAVVAAGALVPPGMAVPPGFLVAGVPAKVRGQLPEKAADEMRRGVKVYVDLKDGYLARRAQGMAGR